MITIAIVAALITAVVLAFQKLLFYIERALCWIVGFLNDLFELVSGLTQVNYNGKGARMIDVFFGNSTIKTIYWGMALIGIVLCFGFTIIAVIRKASDSSDKMKQSMGEILTGTFKGVLLILLMNFILSATITVTSTLMDRVNYLFLNAQSFNFDYTITFDEEDYACMARSLNTIGNYSLNASYNSRYNLNSCYNDIRPDLKRLAEKGKFDATYITTDYDSEGNSYEKNTWQSVLQNIYRSVEDVSVDQPMDEYNTGLSVALLEAMDVIRNDASFAALENYKVHIQGSGFGETVPLDKLVMLMGSMYGDGNGLSRGTGITDYLRGPYYYGQKDIYNYDQLTKDFDFSIGTWNHLTVIALAIFFIKEMLAMVFNATARIFNMLLLYLAAPPFFAVMPLDDGGKTKQWTQAFIIQSLSLFGTLMALRLVMLFIPILFTGDMHLFSGAKLDFFARVIILAGALFTARKASGMIVGILADNAGWQAINAGDLGHEASNVFGKVGSAALAIPGAAMKIGMGAYKVGKVAAWELGKEFGKSGKKTPSGGGSSLSASKLGLGGDKGGDGGTGASGASKPSGSAGSSKTGGSSLPGNLGKNLGSNAETPGNPDALSPSESGMIPDSEPEPLFSSQPLPDSYGGIGDSIADSQPEPLYSSQSLSDNYGGSALKGTAAKSDISAAVPQYHSAANMPLPSAVRARLSPENSAAAYAKPQAPADKGNNPLPGAKK